eukprot:TRINITY_DN5728_c1_g1_i3.p3 TRINITY_DN5728_c1_g1~~TRINITY_DN5728_c1_g1_i3.p3  ORF type:complete len:272 (+),score=68.59 TRINITY_DN5728_c1_g1_i3:1169-1984(+)
MAREAAQRCCESAGKARTGLERMRSAAAAPTHTSEWDAAAELQAAALSSSVDPDSSPPRADSGHVARRALMASEYPAVAGWVLKSDPTFTSWHRRYLVFSRGRLMQLAHEHDTRPKDLCHVDMLAAVELDTYRDASGGVPPPVPHQQRNSLGFFCETQRGGRLRFCCYSVADRAAWMAALRRGLEVARRDGATVNAPTYRAARRRQEQLRGVAAPERSPHRAPPGGCLASQGGCRSLTSPPESPSPGGSRSPHRTGVRHMHSGYGSAARAR